MMHPLGIFITSSSAKAASAVTAVFAYVTRLFVRVCTAVSFFNWVDFLTAGDCRAHPIGVVLESVSPKCSQDAALSKPFV